MQVPLKTQQAVQELQSKRLGRSSMNKNSNIFKNIKNNEYGIWNIKNRGIVQTAPVVEGANILFRLIFLKRMPEFCFILSVIDNYQETIKVNTKILKL